MWTGVIAIIYIYIYYIYIYIIAITPVHMYVYLTIILENLTIMIPCQAMIRFYHSGLYCQWECMICTHEVHVTFGHTPSISKYNLL